MAKQMARMSDTERRIAALESHYKIVDDHVRALEVAAMKAALLSEIQRHVDVAIADGTWHEPSPAEAAELERLLDERMAEFVARRVGGCCPEEVRQ
jgi:hypothetical protein